MMVGMYSYPTSRFLSGAALPLGFDFMPPVHARRRFRTVVAPSTLAVRLPGEADLVGRKDGHVHAVDLKMAPRMIVSEWRWRLRYCNGVHLRR